MQGGKPHIAWQKPLSGRQTARPETAPPPSSKEACFARRKAWVEA